MIAPQRTAVLWTADDLVAATGGRWLRRPAPGWTCTGLCYAAGVFDPGTMLLVRHRQGAMGMLPGHALALAPRAAGLIVANATLLPETPWPVFLVEDTRQALMDAARYARGCFRGRVHAVTGSAGKTSICALLSFALDRLGRVAATTHNTNLPPGVARTLTALPPDADHAVLELAIGRMPVSTRLARPHVAIFSNVAAAHLEYHATLEQVAERKAAIFTGLEPGGLAVINRDMAHFDTAAAVARQHAARLVTYGEGPEADLRLTGQDADGTIRASVHGEGITFRLGMPGRHMALNALAVLAAVDGSGLDWRTHVLPALADARPVEGRGVQHDLTLDGRRLRLIDDAYNANPVSMAAGIALLGDQTPQGTGRRVAVLGDMLELGPDSDAYHTALAGPLAAAGIAVVHTAGPAMRRLWDALPPEQRGHSTTTADDLLPALTDSLRSGDVVLIKGSHGSGVHRLVSGLLEAAARQHPEDASA